MRIDLVSLFPAALRAPLEHSVLKRAQDNGLLDIRHTDIRDYSADDKHRTVDDRPYGGGPGMLLQAEPVCAAVRAVRSEAARVVYLSPQGRPLDATVARELAQEQHLVLLCGAYEGIDQRAIDQVVDEEISIGDYVVMNGCLPALVLVEAVARFVPGVLGNASSADEDCFENGLLSAPQYTRPDVFEGLGVPEVLRGGHHRHIEDWRLEQALAKTRERRPDLYAQWHSAARQQ